MNIISIGGLTLNSETPMTSLDNGIADGNES
mgnify:CR=1 FL=1